MDNTVRLWEPTVRGASFELKPHHAPVRSVDFSADSCFLLTASDDKSCKIYDVRSRRFVSSLAGERAGGHSNWVRSARFSPDARLVVSASEDCSAKLWDIRTHNSVWSYGGNTAGLRIAQFHPQGNVVAMGGADRSIKLYDIRTHKLLQHYAETDTVCNLVFHPSGIYHFYSKIVLNLVIRTVLRI